MMRLLVGCLGWATLACQSATGEAGIERQRVIGTIAFHSEPVHVQLPDTVARGIPFPMNVRTYGGGCTDAGDTEVQLEALIAQVTPYDIEVTHLPPGYVCTLELRSYDHVGQLRFDQSGTASVIIRGRQQPGGTVIEVERRVEVR